MGQSQGQGRGQYRAKLRGLRRCQEGVSRMWSWASGPEEEWGAGLRAKTELWGGSGTGLGLSQHEGLSQDSVEKSDRRGQGPKALPGGTHDGDPVSSKYGWVGGK